MSHPLLLEINTRCWLDELGRAPALTAQRPPSDTHPALTAQRPPGDTYPALTAQRPPGNAGCSLSLSAVPESQIIDWRRLGFTHIWLMGVWTTGPRSRARALAQPRLRQLCAEAFGPDREELLGSSPYAVADYSVAPEFGGEAGLRQFWEKLRRNGLKLILDFIPNHLGLDHPWLVERPELFVSSPTPQPETFLQETVAGPLWIAHGKDPYSPAWDDTAQLDYRRPETRAAMLEILKKVARLCDGVRCDMAMLVLNDIFARTWQHYPGPTPESEFWPEAIRVIRQAHPEFLFLAEVYWNLELALQGQGFDYTYDKVFYDCVVRGDRAALAAHLQVYGANPHMARFLENHDEPPIAARFSLPEHRAAAQLLLRQPCLRLIYQPQLFGRRLHTPIQFKRYFPEPPNPEVAGLYGELLTGQPSDA